MGGATGKNPKKRNKLAGKSTGTSASTKYFNANPVAKEKKNKANANAQAGKTRDGKPSKVQKAKAKKQSKHRVKTTDANRKDPAPKGYDKSATKKGNLVNEKASKNRARNGKNGKSTKK